MINQLKVSSSNLFWKTALFLSMSSILLIGVYFLIYEECSSLIILVGLCCFFVPWSYFKVLDALDLMKKQFQKVCIEDDFLLFEHLPLQGGSTASAQIEYKNIKSVTMKGSQLNILFVQRFEWEGDPCDFITPSGFVPKLQVFSLTWNKKKRRATIALLESKGLFEKR
jgi:hypothetical protein